MRPAGERYRPDRAPHRARHPRVMRYAAATDGARCSAATQWTKTRSPASTSSSIVRAVSSRTKPRFGLSASVGVDQADGVVLDVGRHVGRAHPAQRHDDGRPRRRRRRSTPADVAEPGAVELDHRGCAASRDVVGTRCSTPGQPLRVGRAAPDGEAGHRVEVGARTATARRRCVGRGAGGATPSGSPSRPTVRRAATRRWRRRCRCRRRPRPRGAGRRRGGRTGRSWGPAVDVMAATAAWKAPTTQPLVRCEVGGIPSDGFVDARPPHWSRRSVRRGRGRRARRRASRTARRRRRHDRPLDRQRPQHAGLDAVGMGVGERARHRRPARRRRRGRRGRRGRRAPCASARRCRRRRGAPTGRRSRRLRRRAAGGRHRRAPHAVWLPTSAGPTGDTSAPSRRPSVRVGATGGEHGEDGERHLGVVRPLAGLPLEPSTALHRARRRRVRADRTRTARRARRPPPRPARRPPPGPSSPDPWAHLVWR